MTAPLSGIRIVDLSVAVAGPFGSMLLGDLGAEVIKIESPEGDVSRTNIETAHKGESFFYLALNRNKKSIVLDLDTPTGKKVFYELVKISDIVWDNFRPGSMERLGADYDTLKEINPRIICCSITGYGSSGPYKDRPSYDVVALGIAGLESITGEPDGRPIRPAAPVADMSAGMFCTISALATLRERERTGRGTRVEVSLLDASVSIMAYHLSHYFISGVVPKPLSNSGHPATMPMGVYKTKKGYITLGKCWPRICRAIGADWLADDPRFRDLSSRQKHRDELNTIIEEYLAQAEAEDWLNIFEVEDIAAGPVNTLDKVATDPQILHQKMILSMEHPLGGNIRLTGNPIKMEGVSEEDFTPPPTLDQHGPQILKELLGYSDEEIKKLKEEEKEHASQRLLHTRKVL